MFRRIAAALQIVIILMLLGFATYQFYHGNFEAGMSIVPFLVIYYFFVMSRQKRVRDRQGDDDTHADT